MRVSLITCPICGSGHDPAATGGVCPRCALAAALGTPDTPALPAGDFERLTELGRGAMGVVWLARQRSLDRLVALKVIAAGTRPADWLEARLRREAKSAAQLQHPHLVTVYEVGTEPGGAYLAMEYCEGGSLRERLRVGVLAPRAAAELGAKLAAAVAHAHAAGVLHRDLKPSNILLTAAGEPKVADFGLAAPVAGAGDLTVTGEMLGSPSYLAPEALAAGARLGPAADVYGLGAILYECVTGRPPFTGESVAAVLAQIPAAEPAAPRLVNRDVPADLDTIILHCLQKTPAARYASAAELAEDLRRLLDGRAIRARPTPAVQRAWRWARRHPVTAAAVTAVPVLLAVVAGVSAMAAWRLEQAQHRTVESLNRAEAEGRRAARAEAEAREQLRAALLAQAHATRLTAREGQRRDALAALRQAATIRPGLDARNEAIAALAAPDWEPRQTTKVWSDPGLSTVTPLPGYGAFIHETERGEFSRRRFPEGTVDWSWPGIGSPSAGQTVVSRDGRHVAVRLQNDEIHVLDAANGRPRFRLTGRPFAFKAWRIWGYGVDMAFSPEGDVFAATRAEGGVSFHAPADGRELARWEAKEGMVSVAFAPDGKTLAAGGGRTREENLVAIVEAATGRELRRAATPGRVDFVTWSADARWLAAGTRPVQVHAAAGLSLRAVVPDRAALHACFLADNQRLLLSEQTGQTRLWDIDSGRLLLTKQDSGRPGVWFDGEPPRQWRYFSNGTVDLHALADRPVLATIMSARPNQTVPSIADPVDVSPDGRWLLVGGWAGPTLIDLRAKRMAARLETAPSNSASVARFDPEGAALWVGQSAGPLQRHAFAEGAEGRPLIGAGETVPGHDGFLPTAIQRGAGVLALTDYRGGRVRMFRIRTREIVAEWTLPRASHAAFSPDGQWVLTNAEPAEGARAEIREVATGRLVRTLGGQSGREAVWSADGRWVLAGTARDRVGLWRTDTWEPGPELPVEVRNFSNRGALSPDGAWLAIRGDQAIVLFRTATGETLARLAVADSLRAVPAVRFTPDGRRLIVARMEGQIDLWDLGALRRELGALGLDWAE